MGIIHSSEYKKFFTLRGNEPTALVDINSYPTLQELNQNKQKRKSKHKAHRGIIDEIGSLCLKDKHSNCFKASCACECHKNGK